MIRPEAVRLFAANGGPGAQPESDKHNQIAGTVLYVHYTGTSYLIGLQVPGLDKPFLVKAPMHGAEASPVVREGDSVHAVWPIASTLLL
jgi:hypothetical protein